jgi:hypothetical protein
MKTCFHRLNANQSGVIEEVDFDVFPERFNEVGGLTGEHAQEMVEYYKGVWTTFFKAQDKTEATFESFIENLRTQGKKGILAAVNDLHNRYFTNTDHNNDDIMELEDFTKYFYILGINADMAKETFEAIDSNNDGHISRGEFITAGNDFFTGEHEHKASDLWYGPLVD